jgi:hypothetical protein
LLGVALFAAMMSIAWNVGTVDGAKTPSGAEPDSTTQPSNDEAPDSTAKPADDDAWYRDYSTFGRDPVPPEGAVPSAPADGDVVAQYYERYEGFPHSGSQFLYAYADGRVLSWGWGSDFVSERHLTPEGVDMVRSGALQAADLTPSSSAVPDDLWQDPVIKPFVPSRYAVCYMLAEGQVHGNDGYAFPADVVGFLPQPPRSILEGETTSGEVRGPSDRPICSSITTDEARVVIATLRDVTLKDSEGNEILWELRMGLPQGVHIGHCRPKECG